MASTHQHESPKGRTSQTRPEKSRRISQYSKDVYNTGHTHYSHSDKESKKNQHSETADNHEKGERHRKISHYSRDGGAKGHHGGRGRAGSKREHDRHSVATSGDAHPAVEYENTYKLEPDVVFKEGHVKEIIKQALHENLNGQKYVKGMMGSRCLVLSDVIKERVRQLGLERYKIIAMVLIGEKRDQAMMVSSRCLWNQGYDNFASCQYSKGNLCAVGMVFAVYQE